MTEKRYFVHKHLFRENKVHDKICHNFMSLDETVEHMNNQYWKYKQLKEENEQLKKELVEFRLRYTRKGYTNFCKRCRGFKNSNPVTEIPAIQMEK